MQQLTAREAELLGAETPTNLGHTSLYVELDTGGSDKDRLTLDGLRKDLESRIHLVPGFRRTIHTVPMKLDRPWWLETRLDVDYHLRHIAVPQPHDESSLRGLVARIHERPLDRRRPLWEMYLIDLPNGNEGLLIKIHHVLIDGVTGLDVLAPLTGKISGIKPPEPVRADRRPDDTDLLIRAAWSLVRSPLRLTTLALNGASKVPFFGRPNLVNLLAPWTSPRGAVSMEPGESVAPRVSFNRSIGRHRRVAFASIPTAEIKEVRRAFDVRFNDVVLALIAGSLRHWLVVHDELPTEPLIALAPLLIDSVDDPLATALVPLATQRHEPRRRLLEISAAMAKLSEQVDAQPVNAIRSMYEASPAIAALASRLIVRTGAFTRFLPPFNVYVVNVPGDEAPSYVAGSKVLHQYPLSTLVDGTGLSISVLSHGDVVDFSFVGDRRLVPDVDYLADRISEELRILAGLKAA